MFKDLF